MKLGGIIIREGLKRLYDQKAPPMAFQAVVGWRRNNIRFGGRIAQQKLLKDIRSIDGLINIDHLILTVGKEIPAVPILYSRIVPNAIIEFEALPFRYTRASDHTDDYSLKMTKLLSSKQTGREVETC